MASLLHERRTHELIGSRVQDELQVCNLFPNVVGGHSEVRQADAMRSEI